jgi:polyisoprenoid-binding protein YceI
MRNPLAAVVALPFAVAPAFASDVYVVDKARSEAKFEVSTFYSSITGRMRDIGGVINLDPASPGASSVKFQIVANSVDTGSAELNQQLRSASFLNAAKFSQITFQSTSIRATSQTNVYQVAGELTLHGVTRSIIVPVEVVRVVKDDAGLVRAAFKVRTTLNRKDYGLNWSKVLDHAALIVGDDVKLTVHLVASREAPTPPN